MRELRSLKKRKVPKAQDQPESSEILGERKLLCAVIEMALVDACGCVVSGVDIETARYKARRWLLYSDINTKTPYTFGWICECLSICPYRIRAHVKKLIEENREYIRPTSKIYGLRGTGDHVIKKHRKTSVCS
jgi:hypothetical protein